MHDISVCSAGELNVKMNEYQYVLTALVLNLLCSYEHQIGGLCYTYEYSAHGPESYLVCSCTCAVSVPVLFPCCAVLFLCCSFWMPAADDDTTTGMPGMVLQYWFRSVGRVSW